MILTENELAAVVEKWQARLRLLDWKVLIAVKRAKEMPLEGKEAVIERIYPERLAWITLMDPVDYPPDCALPQDHERNIVHELLHLYTGYFNVRVSGPLHIWEEQMITAVSEALIALDREPR